MATRNPQRRTARSRIQRHSVGTSTGAPIGERGAPGSSDWMAERLDDQAQHTLQSDKHPGVSINLSPGKDSHRGDAKESKRGQQ
jgi:hypothetical protein